MGKFHTVFKQETIFNSISVISVPKISPPKCFPLRWIFRVNTFSFAVRQILTVKKSIHARPAHRLKLSELRELGLDICECRLSCNRMMMGCSNSAHSQYYIEVSKTKQTSAVPKLIVVRLAS